VHFNFISFNDYVLIRFLCFIIVHYNLFLCVCNIYLCNRDWERLSKIKTCLAILFQLTLNAYFLSS